MDEQGFSYCYNPNNAFPAPYTIISPNKMHFTSKNLKQPFFYEVYCPYSCKKIKIGLNADGKR